MSSTATVILVISVILAILVIVFLIFVFNRVPPTAPGAPPDNPCQVDMSTLTDLSNSPCCVINGATTGIRLNGGKLFGNFPTEPLIACAPLCVDASYNPTTGVCLSGSSTAFQQCWQPITAVNCAATALPDAILGNQVYYLMTTDPQACPSTGPCIVNNN